MPIQYHHYLIAITLLLSFLCLKFKPGDKKIVLLRFFLLLNLIFELAANVKWYIYHESNQAVYNIVISYTFVFWLLLLRIILKGKYKKTISSCIALFLIFYLLNIFFIQGWQVFNTYSYLSGTCLALFLHY